MRLTLPAVNDALAKLGTDVRLAKGPKYFYFHEGEAANWLDTTVDVQTIGSFTLEQWIAEFKRLEKLNRDLLKTTGRKSAPKTHARK